MISKYWGVYLNDFFDLMGWDFDTHLAIGPFTIDVAPAVIVAFFTTLLVFGTKLGARVDGAMTVLKIAIVLFVVIVGFFSVKAENFTPFIPPSEPSTSSEAVMNQPLWQWVTGMTPVDLRGARHPVRRGARVLRLPGFDVVATASEEAENPKRNVPLGIGVGLVLWSCCTCSWPS